MAELGVGYISIVPEVSKITPGVSKALDGLDPVAERSGKSMGGRISSGIGTVLKASVAGAGLAAGGVLAGAITKGMGRLTGIENAQASLRGLGHDAASVESIMDNALASVSGTAFGLDAAAGVAASAVAAGIKPGQELERTLKLTGDAATIAGIEMSEMGSIVNKVATSDMMQMDVANQLMDAGIPILQMVAAELGVTAEEARKMASDGEVSFETFQTALEKGVGGAALEAGNTFQGAFANMGAALGRLGATGLEPFFELSKQGFGAVTDLLDDMNARLKPLASSMGDWLQGTAVPGLIGFKDSALEAWDAMRGSSDVQSLLSQTGIIIGDMVSTGRDLVPVMGQAASAIAQASSALGVGTWQLALVGLEGIGAAAKLAVPPLEMLTGFMQAHPSIVTAAVAAYAGFKTIPALTERITGGLENMNLRVGSATEGFGTLGPTMQRLSAWSKDTGVEMSKLDILMQATGDTGTGVAQKMAQAYLNASAPLKQYAQAHRDAGTDAWGSAVLASNSWDAADHRITSAGHNIVASVTGMAGTVKGVGASAFTGLKSAASGVLNFFGGPWAIGLAAAGIAVTAVVQANQKAEVAQEAMATAARESASAQDELRVAVAGTTGALNEQALASAATIVKGELAEIIELGEAYSGWIRKVDTDTNVWERVFNIGGEWEADKARAREVKAEYEALESVLKDMGLTTDDVNRVVAEGGAEYATLMGLLRGLGDEGISMAEKLGETRSTLDGMIADARRLDPAVAQAAAAIDVLAESSGNANDKLGALESLMQAMGLAPKDAEAAMMDAAAAVDEIVEAATGAERPFEQMGDALFGIEGKLDPTNEGARDLAGTLNNLRGELQNVAVNGGDVWGAFDGMAPALQAIQEEFGLTDEQLQQLQRSFGLMPQEIITAVALEGASEAVQQLGDVWAAVEGIPPGQEIEVSALTSDAQAALELAGYTIKDIPGSTNVMVSADTEGAQGKLADVIRQMADMDGLEVSPELFLNDRPLVDSAANAQGILDALAIQTPTPEAKIIIDQLLSGVDISQGQLNFLATQTPTPVADLERSLLANGVTVSSQLLNELHNQPTRPMIDANAAPLFGGVDQAKLKLNELQDKTVTIRIQEWREYYASGAATSTGGTAVGQHYPTPRGATGGRFDPKEGFAYLPAYVMGGRHDGYRLPSSGPGTERTDGFLAVDSTGTPVAHLDKDEWVVNGKSSEKYNRVISLINRDDPSVQHLSKLNTGGRAGGSDELLIGRPADEVMRFARGERVGGHQANRALEGAPYVWGGINWGDCSGAIAALARFAVGLAPFAARFATGNQREALASMGFAPGLGGPGDFNVGWFNGGAYGGHTSATIDGVNMEMGGGRGNGQIGGGAAPASHPQYTDHAHLPLGSTVGAQWNAVDPGLQWQPTGASSTGGGIINAGSGGSGGSSRSSTPRTWSELAGFTAQQVVSGQVSDALNVFGLSDSPGFLNAYGEWIDATTLEQQNTMLKVDEEKVAKLERDIQDAEDDLRIKRLKVGELKADASASSRETATLAVTKAERKIEDLTKDLEEVRRGKIYQVREDGTLGSEVKDQVVPTGPQRAPTLEGLHGALQDALLAVVGDRPAPAVLPKAVTDMLATIPAFRDGGWVSAPGGPRDDMGLARVSDSEFIVNAGAAQRNRALLEHVNAGGTVPTSSRGDTHFHIQGGDTNEIIRRLTSTAMSATMQHLGG